MRLIVSLPEAPGTWFPECAPVSPAPSAGCSKVGGRHGCSGTHRPIYKPDLSNYVKSAEDALNGVVWKDDQSIVTEHTGKWYSEHPRIELEIKRLEGDK